LRNIDFIVLHCSDSTFGDAKMIDEWHRERGFRKIGYHYVIPNGYRTKHALDSGVMDATDGMVELGRDENEIGAHVEGYNANSIGVCLIGKGAYTGAQMETARGLIVETLLQKYPGAKLLGHYELNPGKTCPMIDMDELRSSWLV
jgi:N-acetylmuramoyl-L-alanine amidase